MPAVTQRAAAFKEPWSDHVPYPHRFRSGSCYASPHRRAGIRGVRNMVWIGVSGEVVCMRAHRVGHVFETLLDLVHDVEAGGNCSRWYGMYSVFVVPREMRENK